MNKTDIYKFLDDNNIIYEVIEHKPVFKMDDLISLLPDSLSVAKNLFLRDDKKENYYLITVRNFKKVDLKKFKSVNNTRHLSFASDEELENIMKLKPGSVSPMGLLNDEKLKVGFYLDREFLNGDSIIGVHPNDNTVTILIKVYDLIKIIEQHGNKVNIVSL